MRNLILSALAIALISLTASAQLAEKASFRNVPWYSSKAEVIKLDDDQLLEMGEGEMEALIAEKTQLGGFQCSRVYFFLNGEFTIGTYAINPFTYSNEDKYVAGYKSWLKALIDKYGPPKNSGENWVDESAKGSPLSDGWNIKMGKLELESNWSFIDGSAILLQCSAEDSQMRTVLAYYSPKGVEQIAEKNKGF